MTEDEAKTKFCPFTFAVPEIRDGDGCGIRQGGPWECRASACMAWQWSEDIEEQITDEKCQRCEGAGICVTGSGENVGGDDCPDCQGAGYIFAGMPTGFCGLTSNSLPSLFNSLKPKP